MLPSMIITMTHACPSYIQRQGYLLTNNRIALSKGQEEKNDLFQYKQISSQMLAQNNFLHLHQNIFKNTLKNIRLVNTLEDCYKSYHKEHRRTKAFSKQFSKHTKHKKFSKHELASKSPQKTTDGKGANTFPFYNLPPPPNPRNISKKEFFCAFFLSLLDKIKVGGDSCLPRHFANTKCKTQTSIKQSVLPPYHRTGDSAGDL